MSSPTFTQPERRSYVVPILLAFAAIAIAVAVARIYFPATTIETELIHTDLLPTTTVYKADTMLIGVNQKSNTLFIASTIKVTNGHRVPIFLDNFTLTLTDPTDAQLSAKAATKAELANMEVSFPALTPLAAKPLLRDTTINPGQSAEGTLIFSLPIPKPIWTDRKQAVIQIDIYHDHPAFQEIPKETQTKP